MTDGGRAENNESSREQHTESYNQIERKNSKGFKQKRELVRILISNYVFAMKEHLRNGVKREELKHRSSIETP